jgi:pimeloyl-ACP methyl ester carboxylesterase
MLEPLLLLPGMMCDARLFTPQIAHFGADREVIVADLTGADSIADIAQQVLAKAPDRFAMLGLSMGGIVAMEIMRIAAHRVTRLALLDTNPKAELEQTQAAREPQMERVKNGGLYRVMQEELKPRYLADGPQKRDVLDICMDMAIDLGEAVFVRQSRALQKRPDQQMALSKVDVPTLILMGEEDQLCPLDRHQLMAELISHANLVIVSKAGHMPCLEQPIVTNKAIDTWLQQ